MAEYALIIGINIYKDKKSIPSLMWARNDALELRDTLINSNYWGIPRNNIVVLVDEDAVKDNILGNINELSRKARRDDTVIIHFSGHGAATADRQGDEDDSLSKHLVPYEAQGGNLFGTALPFRFLPEYLNQIKSKRVIVTLDCCYSGGVGGRTFLDPSVKPKGALNVGGLFLHKVSGMGRAIVTACDTNEIALENNKIKHGFFSHCLIQGLKGDADLRKDGVVDFDELWMYLASEVPRISDGVQHPVMVGWVTAPSLVLSHPKVIVFTEEEKIKIESEIVRKYANYKIRTVRIANSVDLKDLAFEAVQYLEGRLTNHFKLSVSCGRTLANVISQMADKELDFVDIFPLNIYPSETVEIIDSNTLTSLLRIKITGSNTCAHSLSISPLRRLPQKIRDAYTLAVKKICEETFARAKDSDMFVFGIGQPTAPNANVAYVLNKANLTSEKLCEIGSVGEINFHLYDRDGEFLITKTDLPQDQKNYLQEYYQQFFAFSVEDLRKITKRPGIDLVAVAGGEEKWEAILGAIKGNLVRTLITDARTARWLLYEAVA